MEKSSTATKKFINNHQNVVIEAIEGLCLINPNIKRIENTQIVTLKTPGKGVNLLCGGGSGHEPAHAGFVCDGMLSVAVCGGVFASPPYQEVLEGIAQVANENGVLVIIKNYTGDIINFELAADIARSKGIKVKTLHVQDDVSLGEHQVIGRRGLAGTVLLYKILGAAADKLNLDELHELGTSVLEHIHTIGVSFSACSLPGHPAMYKLPDDEMEIGLGIHGEKGLERVKVKTCEELIEDLLKKFSGYVQEGDEVVVLVNNLGSCTDIEMMIIVRTLLKSLNAKKIKTARVVQGKIMTSLEMHGMSISLFPLQKAWRDDVLKYLDAPVNNTNWNISTPVEEKEIYTSLKQPIDSILDKQIKRDLDEKGKKLKGLLTHVFTSLSKEESLYNQLDAEVGDGDLGSGVARASNNALKNIDFFPFDKDVVVSLQELGGLMAHSFGGTSGPLYGFFLIRGATQLRKSLEDNKASNWLNAFKEGVGAIQNIGKGKQGDRTMLDALFPVLEAFEAHVKAHGDENTKDLLEALAKAAVKGADDASKLQAKKGRSSYLQGKEIGKKDPGCELVAQWVNLVQEGYAANY